MRWIVIALMTLNAGWMTFDGARALVVGDYVTPRSGPHAGRLGPWSSVLTALGIEPRSTPVKTAFVVYGLLTLAAVVAFAMHAPGSRRTLLIAAAAGLWYLPIGTGVNAVVLVLLLVGHTSKSF